MKLITFAFLWILVCTKTSPCLLSPCLLCPSRVLCTWTALEEKTLLAVWCVDVSKQHQHESNRRCDGNLRVQPDLLQSHGFPGDFVLGFVNHSIRPLSDLLHLLERVHVRGNFVQPVSSTALFVRELTAARWLVGRRAVRGPTCTEPLLRGCWAGSGLTDSPGTELRVGVNLLGSDWDHYPGWEGSLAWL